MDFANIGSGDADYHVPELANPIAITLIMRLASGCEVMQGLTPETRFTDEQLRLLKRQVSYEPEGSLAHFGGYRSCDSKN